MKCLSCQFTLIAGDGNVQSFRKRIILKVFHNVAHFIRSVNQVFAAALNHIERDYIFMIEARITFFFSKSIFHFSNVFKIKCGTALTANHNVCNVFYIFKLT